MWKLQRQHCLDRWSHKLQLCAWLHGSSHGDQGQAGSLSQDPQPLHQASVPLPTLAWLFRQGSGMLLAHLNHTDVACVPTQSMHMPRLPTCPQKVSIATTTPSMGALPLTCDHKMSTLVREHTELYTHSGKCTLRTAQMTRASCYKRVQQTGATARATGLLSLHCSGTGELTTGPQNIRKECKCCD